jgi:hypothetical protein
MNMLGTLRSSPAFDSNVVTTQRALASMMFQMEMTVRRQQSPRILFCIFQHCTLHVLD